MRKPAKKGKGGHSAKDVLKTAKPNHLRKQSCGVLRLALIYLCHALPALVRKPAKKAKGGQSAKDALKAAAKQRRLEKQSAKPESPPWDNYNRKGREVTQTQLTVSLYHLHSSP